jgi:hypothetical protein
VPASAYPKPQTPCKNIQAALSFSRLAQMITHNRQISSLFHRVFAGFSLLALELKATFEPSRKEVRKRFQPHLCATSMTRNEATGELYITQLFFNKVIRVQFP